MSQTKNMEYNEVIILNTEWCIQQLRHSEPISSHNAGNHVTM